MTITTEWREEIAEWAASTDDVVGVIAFGSRVTGVRRETESGPSVSDLDLAIETVDEEDGPLGRFLALQHVWEADLTARLGVTVDLRHHDPADAEDDVAEYLALGSERLWPSPDQVARGELAIRRA